MMKEWILYFAVLEMKVWLVWDQVMKKKMGGRDSWEVRPGPRVGG
jgi:hypothetical protein